jgi:hypothetical protein
MCFINDNYDWIAEVWEESTETATKPVRCQECREQIPVGGTLHCIHMQEHEECHRCFGDHFDEDDERCPCSALKDRYGACTECKCEKPDFGESEDYWRCENCDKFLNAVESAEVEAGCSTHEARPGLGMMLEDIINGDRHGAKRYFKTALAMYPELKASGYLGRLGKFIFDRG